ncbi:hypothetical protein EDC04DRAFT_2608827 [Pisolithus marmoratus]|nr:hypothetical protein EDC04DRAFT_2608827 [Pisolithus marmoratus]
MKWVKVVSMPLPDEIAWFSLASVDPPLVNHTLMRFLAQWWQDGDTGQVCYGEFAGKLACIITMDSLDVPVIFLASYISLTMYISQEPHNQLWDDPLTYQNCIQPGDFVCIISGPHKGLCSMLHWYSGCEILITLSMLQQADPDNLGDKGSPGPKNPNMDKVLIIPPSTLQFSREKGYDVTIGNCVQVAHGPAISIKGLICPVDFVSGHLTVLADDGPLHDVLIGFCIKLENHSLHDVEHQVGHKVWIISGPRKGYRGMLQSVGRTYCNVMIESGIMQLKNTAVVTDTTPPMSQLTVDPSAEPGPSTLACGPWVPHSDDITPWPLNELAQADADYGCVPWLFDNNFCDYANWHVCLRVAMSYNHGSLLKQVVHTMVPDHFSMVIHGLGLAPPGHVSVTVTSSTVGTNIEHHFIPVHDLTPANPRSAGQYCLILHGELTGQIHQVKKCQVKKDLKGVELEDSTKLPLRDVCQGSNAIHVLPEIWLCSKDNGCDPLTFPQCCSKAIISIYTIA